MTARILILTFGFVLLATSAFPFGVDVCFNDPASKEEPVRSCIDVGQQCRTDRLGPTRELTCRALALFDSLSGLGGGNAIIGGRSLVHSDSTYLMAQVIGFTPWQAYQIMIYSEATDQSEYVPFDQTGTQMLSDAEVAYCQQSWGPAIDTKCLLMMPTVNGVYKFNSYTGGQLLHLHARHSADGSAPPSLAYPVDFFAPGVVEHEAMLSNFRAWVFDERGDACAAGITQEMQYPESISSECEDPDHFLNSPINFFSAGFSFAAIPFVTRLGTLIINEDEAGQLVLANDASLQSYVSPHDADLAKLGIFVHHYGDRFSHHKCTDESFFYGEPDGDYNSAYDSVNCAQGAHFLWHVYEQGTRQVRLGDPAFHTMEPALEAVFDLLVESAGHLGIQVGSPLDKDVVVADLLSALEIFDPVRRLDAMVELMEAHGLLPLPGHGSASGYTTEEWLQAAGAPGF